MRNYFEFGMWRVECGIMVFGVKELRQLRITFGRTLCAPTENFRNNIAAGDTIIQLSTFHIPNSIKNDRENHKIISAEI